MFGKNAIVGQKFFDEAKDKLFITSIFFTLQGEGPFRGMPSVFVRLAKCNLACSFCDTYFDGGDWLTVDEIEQRIETAINQHFENNVPEWAEYYPQYDTKRNMVLVVTGGEPMLQKNLVPFLHKMNKQFKHTQIESNGIIWQNIPEETVLVVSPKCLEKNGRAVKYLEPNHNVMQRANALKFVMSADKDSPYSTVPDWALRLQFEKEIFVSPMNIYNREPQKSKLLRNDKNDISIEERSTVDEVISFWEEGLLDMQSNQKNHEYTAKYCLTHGLTLNLQIHLYASLA